MKNRKLQDLETSDPRPKPERSLNHKSLNVTTPINTAKGLVLDDILAEIKSAHHLFKIAPAKLSLGDLGVSQKTRSQVERLLAETIELRQGQIFTLRSPLLDTPGHDIYGQEFESLFALRHQVSPRRQAHVLRRVLEVGLQTIVSLPSKDPGGHVGCKALKSLASSLSRLSEKMHMAVRDDYVQARLELLPTKSELWNLPGAMQDAADRMEAAANLKGRKFRLSSPNPQIRFTLYLANWVKVCTGRPHYALLTDLLKAAFEKSRKAPPKWIGRLEIEMNRKRRHGAEWFKHLTS